MEEICEVLESEDDGENPRLGIGWDGGSEEDHLWMQSVRCCTISVSAQLGISLFFSFPVQQTCKSICICICKGFVLLQ